MIRPTEDVLQQFAEIVIAAHEPHGLSPSIENLGVWYSRLRDLTLKQVEHALFVHSLDHWDKLPTPDGIRESIVGDERDPVEKLQDEVAELRAVVADLQRRIDGESDAAQVKPTLRHKQKRKPGAAVAKPVQLSLLPEVENAGVVGG